MSEQVIEANPAMSEHQQRLANSVRIRRRANEVKTPAVLGPPNVQASFTLQNTISGNGHLAIRRSALSSWTCWIAAVFTSHPSVPSPRRTIGKQITVPKRLKQLWKERTGRDDLDQMTDFLRLRGFANCWHVNSHESVAMWNQYARGENTLVLRSTVGKLCDAFVRMPRNRSCRRS